MAWAATWQVRRRMGGGGRRPQGQWRRGDAPASVWEGHTWHRPTALATVRKTPRTDRRSEASLGVRASGGGSVRRDVARVARVGSFEISFSAV
jgi:hypothetical protein